MSALESVDNFLDHVQETYADYRWSNPSNSPLILSIPERDDTKRVLYTGPGTKIDRLTLKPGSSSYEYADGFINPSYWKDGISRLGTHKFWVDTEGARITKVFGGNEVSRGLIAFSKGTPNSDKILDLLLKKAMKDLEKAATLGRIARL